MDVVTRKSWRSELKLNRSKSLATPAWLWKSVLQLLASHEVGYLEHCRKYALHYHGVDDVVCLQHCSEPHENERRGLARRLLPSDEARIQLHASECYR